MDTTSGRRDEIVEAARALLEEHGPDGLTMRAIAQRVGMQAPSLYKHFPDKDAVEVALMAQCFLDQAAAFSAALVASSDPLGDLAVAYRRWALDHPHLYRLMTQKPIPRAELPAGVEDAAAGPLVALAGGDIDLARALWAFAHGLVSLEIAQRLPADADIDAAWRAGLVAFGGPRD